MSLARPIRRAALAPPLLAALLAAPLAGPLAAQEGGWIVTDADVLPQLRSFSAAEPAPEIGRTVEGRLVSRLPESYAPRLQSLMHTAHGRCGGYTIHPSQEAAEAEAANPFYSPEYLSRAGLFPGAATRQADVLAAIAAVDGARIVGTIGWLEAMGTRHYQSASGAAAATQLRDRWAALAPGRADFEVELFDHPSWAQSSVIATIRGADAPGEYVVLGGHLDSIASPSVLDAPGADDDASGIATVQEVMEVILASGIRPSRSIAFMAYAAEEVGLRGSNAIAADWDADPAREVIAALQLDMTGFGGSSRDVYLITDYTSADLNDFLRMLMAEYNGPGPHEITHGDTACGYGCSDHVSWSGVGVPAAFPFEALFADYNRAIHTPGDTLALLDGTGARQGRFAKLGIEFAIELAGVSAPAPAPAPAPGRIGFAWGDDAAGTRGYPSPTYAHVDGGGAVTGTRRGPGLYEMRFEGLGGGARAGAHVQVTGYGGDAADCKVVSWRSTGDDAIVIVQCLTAAGQPADARYTVLVQWP